MITRNGEPMETGTGESLAELVDRRIARRTLLKGMLAFPIVALGPCFLLPGDSRGAEIDQLRYQPISTNSEDEIKVPPGYILQKAVRISIPTI